jgi:hypothetical protein
MGVFNHTGRHFFAFKDLQQNGWNSSYKDWYLNVDFSRKSCFETSLTTKAGQVAKIW